MKTTFKKNKVTKEKIREKEKLALQAVGIKWQEIVTNIITVKGIVDSGALRDSMDFQILENGKVEILVGTPKEYAPINELGGANKNYPARPFLMPSVMQYSEAYKKIVKAILESK